jgi:hypothetical protein
MTCNSEPRAPIIVSLAQSLKGEVGHTDFGDMAGGVQGFLRNKDSLVHCLQPRNALLHL